MHDHTILLISSDPSLADSVREGLPASARSRLRVVEAADEAVRIAARGQVGVIILHLDETVASGHVARLMWEAASRPRRVPVLAVSDRYESDRATAMLRLGAVDYLSRPDHLNRLAPLVGSLAAGGEGEAELDAAVLTGPSLGLGRWAFSAS